MCILTRGLYIIVISIALLTANYGHTSLSKLIALLLSYMYESQIWCYFILS